MGLKEDFATARREDMREIEEQAQRAMTLRRVLDSLGIVYEENSTLDAPLFFACNYGDFHKTQQAIPATEVLELYTSDLKTSAYSQSGVAVIDYDRDTDYEEEQEENDHEYQGVIVLQ